MKEFVVIYEWTGNNYSAYVPDLPGCVACADTLEQTEVLVREGIRLYIQTLREEHRAIPEPTTKAKLVSIGV